MNPKALLLLFVYLFISFLVWDRVSSCSPGESWPPTPRSACPCRVLGLEERSHTQPPIPLCSSGCYISLNHESSHSLSLVLVHKWLTKMFGFFVNLPYVKLIHILAPQQVRGELFFISLYLGCSLFWLFFTFHPSIHSLGMGMPWRIWRAKDNLHLHYSSLPPYENQRCNSGYQLW